jgi:hypothetical protein
MGGVIAVLTIIVALLGAPGGRLSAERTAGDVKVQVSVGKDAYAIGEPVTVRLRVTNQASGPIAITMYTGQQYDLLVRQRGALIWQWSYDKAFTQVVRETSMPPGETLAFTWTWDQRDLQGRQVEPGAYDISAVFMGAQRSGPRSIEAGPVRVTIGR